MPLRHALLCSALALAAASAAVAAPPVVREEVGNRVSENIPAIPPALVEQLNRYQNTRGATSPAGPRRLHADQHALRRDRAGASRVPADGHARAADVLSGAACRHRRPAGRVEAGWLRVRQGQGRQRVLAVALVRHEVARARTLLTDGKARKRRRCSRATASASPAAAPRATARTRDIWVTRLRRRTKPRTLVTEGGQWTAMDFSPDGKRLLVMKYVSAAESYPGVGRCRHRQAGDVPGRWRQGGVRRLRASRRTARRCTSSPTRPHATASAQEFHTLRYHDPASGKFEVLTATMPWDVEDLEHRRRRQAPGLRHQRGRHLASCTCCRCLRTRAVKLPALPVGVVGRRRLLAGRQAPGGDDELARPRPAMST